MWLPFRRSAGCTIATNAWRPEPINDLIAGDVTRNLPFETISSVQTLTLADVVICSSPRRFFPSLDPRSSGRLICLDAVLLKKGPDQFAERLLRRRAFLEHIRPKPSHRFQVLSVFFAHQCRGLPETDNRREAPGVAKRQRLPQVATSPSQFSLNRNFQKGQPFNFEEWVTLTSLEQPFEPARVRLA